MTLDATTGDPLLKEHYTDDVIEDLTYEENPLYATMTKMEDFGGRGLPIPIIYGTPQGRSANFSIAQTRALATSTLLKSFELTPVADYCVGVIDGQVLRRTKGEKNAWMEAATTEIDGVVKTLSRSVAVKQYRSGWGLIGIIGSISTNVITLPAARIDEITNFEVGQQLVFSQTESASLLRNSGGTTTLNVTAVDRSAGTITLSANVSTITGTVANDSIFCNGDRQDSATPTRQCIAGLEAWVPQTAPTSTTFFGVDRTSDSVRLAGVRYDTTTTSAAPAEVLVEMVARVGREGQMLTHIYGGFGFYKSLVKSLMSQVQYVDVEANARVSFRGVEVISPWGTVTFVPDMNCPPDRLFGLNMKFWKLYTTGKAIRLLDEDGNTMLRQSTADGYEIRYGFLGNQGTRAPGANINAKI